MTLLIHEDEIESHVSSEYFGAGYREEERWSVGVVEIGTGKLL